ncbi:MAG TPA: 4-hydroxyphenylpyruvate dioxygenase [Acidimicrobiia bacterium]|nr:4-hydroxyphenylpyruvate dioxygenase [Acidimicrobiia bacterium]
MNGHDGLSLGGVDHVEFWVGNARQASHFWRSAFGFEVVAYAGPETGIRDRVSYVLQQGDVRFVVSGALGPDSPVAEHHRTHGDGAKVVAFLVDDAEAAFETAVGRGAPAVREPWVEEDDAGKLTRASVAAYGDTVHTFVERSAYSGVFAPGFEATERTRPPGRPVGLRAFDHIVANVELGRLEEWVAYYRDIFGFDRLVHFDDSQISTEYSALMSTVVWDGTKVVLPINEPAEGRRKSQIEEYLEYYGSPGVQHIALRTDDIVSAVAAMRERGLRFLDVPPTYYDDARERMEGIDLPWEELSQLGILVDRDPDGHLLQIFTEMIGDRPTVFIEIIQREGSRGFGVGNFKALFEAIEREQSRRGNL